MAGSHTGRSRWMDPGFYPVNKNLVDDAKAADKAIFLVDIGGGKGHDLQELHQQYPNLPGRLILQDLNGVIREAEASGLDKKIITMEHDFFKPQPIKGIFTIAAWNHLLTKCRGTSLLHAYSSTRLAGLQSKGDPLEH